MISNQLDVEALGWATADASNPKLEWLEYESNYDTT